MLIYQFFKNFESICPIYPKSPDIFIQRKSSQDFNAGILGRYENRDKEELFKPNKPLRLSSGSGTYSHTETFMGFPSLHHST